MHLPSLTADIQEQILFLPPIESGQDVITDSGLTHLSRLTKLSALRLAGTQVTDDGVEALQRAMLEDGFISH
jgi:UDP-N-acetylglucosamine enolpyruvyl transferase